MTVAIAGGHPSIRPRSLSGILLAVVLGTLLALSGAQPASAHAQLISTTPTDGSVLSAVPAEIELVFSEPVQLIDGGIRLFPGDGTPVTMPARAVDGMVTATVPATVFDELGDGSYALSYRVVSADGHPIAGAITFTVGEAVAGEGPVVAVASSDSTSFAQNALTFVQYLALLVFAGLVLFHVLVLRTPGGLERADRRVLLTAGFTAAAATLALIPVTALRIVGEELTAIVDPARWTPGVLWPMLVAALVVVAGTVPGVIGAIRPWSSPILARIALPAALLALAAPVLVGHTQLAEPRPLMIIADLGHLVAGALWLGGLVGLLLFLANASPDRRDSSPQQDPLVAATVVVRFSNLAIWSVVLLAVSGVFMATLILGTVEALVTTTYGLTLLLKFSIVIAVVAIAFWNRRVLVPAIRAQPTSKLRWRTLQRAMVSEAALLTAVLVVTGVLTNLSPSHDGHDAGGGSVSQGAASGLVQVDGVSQDLALVGSFEPGLVGENRLIFTLENQGDSAVPESVIIRMTLPAHDLGPFEVEPVVDAATGEYVAILDLPVAGEWEVQVIARVSTFVEPIITIPVVVR